jgi:putative salt-induced outer membrane protein YdiY
MRYLILLIFAVIPVFTQVNTEQLRKYNIEDGIYHKIDFGFGITKGNSELVKVSGAYRIDYILNKYNAFFAMNYSYQEANEKKNVNKGFAHIRGTYEWYEFLMPEVYIQKEFNEFIQLKDRYLFGSGLRYNPIAMFEDLDEFNLKFFIGSGFMYEFEDYSAIGAKSTNLIRSSSYLTVNWDLNEIVSFSSTAYLQFVVDNYDDRRLLNQTSLEFQVSDNFKFYTKYNYRLDSEPLPGIKDYDMDITNGITVNF